jgi:hypothetical protein
MDKVVFVSSDKVYFNVDKELLARRRYLRPATTVSRSELTYSTVFKDMFDMRRIAGVADADADVIPLNEKAEHLEKFFDCLNYPNWVEGNDLQLPPAETSAVIALSHRFGIDDMYENAVACINWDVEHKTFGVFTAASWRQDVALGRRAISRMGIFEGEDQEDQFWDRIADARSEWQIELVRRLLPKLRYVDPPNKRIAHDAELARPITAAVNRDMKQVAESFNPK